MQSDGVTDAQITQTVAKSVARFQQVRDEADARELLSRGITPDYRTWSYLEDRSGG